MKVRIGYGLGAQRARATTRASASSSTRSRRCGFDSLWLSERLSGDAPDPIVGLAFAAGRTEKLKLGTSVQVLPGRNPALLAKEWASLDVLSGGRTAARRSASASPNPAEQQAFGVAREERAGWFDEALPLVRRLWTEDAVDHDGPRFRYRGARASGRSRCSSRPTCGSAAGPRASCGGSAGSATAGSRASRPRRRWRRDASSSRRPRPTPAARSTTSTSARS